jgi:hypothetical protein
MGLGKKRIINQQTEEPATMALVKQGDAPAKCCASFCVEP